MLKNMAALSGQTNRCSRIQRRLMVWGLGLLAAALLINTFAGSLYTHQAMSESTARLQAEVASVTALRMHSLLRREIDRLDRAGSAMMDFPIGSRQQRRLADLLVRGSGSIESVSLISGKGVELFRRPGSTSASPMMSGDFRKLPELITVFAGRFYLKAAPGVRPTEPSWVTLTVPLRNDTGAVVGWLVARARLDFLAQAVKDVKFGRGGRAYLVDDSGLLIAHPDPSYTFVKRNLEDLPKVRQFLSSPSADVNPASDAVGIQGERVVSTYARIGDLGWAIIVEEPLDAIADQTRDLYVHASVLAAAGLLLGAIVIIWLSRRITRPIQQLRDSIEIIRQGNLAHRAKVCTGDEIEELATEFNRMTAALEQSTVTLEQRVEQRTQEIAALYEITAIVSRTLDVDAVLDTVIKRITALFGFDSTRVYLRDADGELISLRGCYEVNPEPWVNIGSFKLGQGIVGNVVETGVARIFEDVACNRAYLEIDESRAPGAPVGGFLAAFPIKTKHSCYGALIFSSKYPRSLKEEEIRLLGSMADQIGVAVENSSLYNQARAKSAHLAVLNEVAAAVSRSLDLETVLGEALDKVISVLKFDAAWAYMMDEEQAKLQLRACKGISPETARMLAPQGARSGFAKRSGSGGRLVALDTGEEIGSYREALLTLRARRRAYGGSIAVPITAREKVIGVLYAVSWQSRRYSADDVRLVESVAQEIGVAVENAKLFAEIRKQSAELEKVNQELRAATQAKSEFIAAMSHELRTPLNIMIGNADITHDGIFGEINDEQKNAMRKIARNGHVLLKMINDLLKLSRLEAKRMTLEPTEVDIHDVLQHAQDQIAQLNRDGRLEIGWTVEKDLPRLFTDPGKLEEILHNLIGNAFKFTATGRIDISVRHDPEERKVEFSVADTGIGIPIEDRDRVFEKFEQVKSPGKTKNDGVGLGLSIVRKYLDLVQGGIRLDSAPGKGAKFTFWLPYAVHMPPADATAQAELRNLAT